MMRLTPNQRKVHAFLLDYRALNGRPPSYPEIAMYLGHVTKTTARDCCAALVRRGLARYIDVPKKSERNVVGVGACHCATCGQPLPSREKRA